MTEPWPGRRRHNAFYNVPLGNWEWLKGKKCYLYMRDICDLLTDDRIQTVELQDIAWPSKHHYPHHTGENCHCCRKKPSLRYLNADITLPGILVEGAPNPYNNKYRMIDGRHRIMKMLDMGIKSSQFYVLDCDVVTPLLTDPS